MNTLNFIFRTFLMIVFLVSSGRLNAQYIIEQIEYEIPISYELIPEDAEFESQEDEINFFLDIPEGKLKQAALAEGSEITEEKSTIYIDGDNFAVETVSEDEGKVTMVSDAKTGVLVIIMWSQSKIIEVNPGDIEKMVAKSQAAVDKMMENLSPEMREQIKSKMALEKNTSPAEYDVQSTGKKMNLYGFNCEEYRINKDEEVIAIWATGDESGLVKAVDRVSKKMKELVPSDDDEDVDEWKAVPGKIPVQVRTYTSSMMGDPVLDIQTITKIENKKPSADKFKIPGANEGFTKGSMMDMRMQDNQ
ncbi:DUF4412 domain-containing protein [candidate division KSB1 bacterium]|nr:DUF4412 domain-containing protein [candidate division KSB1 bacterium]